MALEQNEIKKVITVDLGNTTTSLKDYKKHIDELKGSLLQLDSASEEYQKIAQEVKTEQDKLNEVMKVGKTTTDAADGSYNQLTQTMAELKKQWRATADETERADLGKQILDINNQLKELDASTGNYQRNVGDYANAFEQAFGKCLDGMQKIDGPLGEIGGKTKQLIPLIKEINSNALKGLSGIKKGIAATGIGALVVAVGLLAAHWEDVVDAVNKAIIKNGQYADAIEASKLKQEQLKQAVIDTNSEIEKTIRLMAAQGASALEQANRLHQLRSRQMADAQTEATAARQAADEAKAHLDEVQAAQDRAIARGQRGSIASKLGNDMELLSEDLVSLRANYEALEATAVEAETQLSDITKEYQKAVDGLEVAVIAADASIETSLRSQGDALKYTYEQNLRNLDIIRDQRIAAATTTDEIAEIEADTANKRERLTQKYLDDLKKLNTSAHETYENIERLTPIEIIPLKPIPASEITLSLEYIKNEIAKKKEEIDKELGGGFSFLAEPDQTELEKIDSEYQAYATLIRGKMNLNMELMSDDRLNAEERRQLVAEQEDLQNKLTIATQMYSEKRKKIIQDETNAAIKMNMLEAQNIASSMAGLFGALSDMYEEDSEEQKSLAIMETIINGLQAVIGTWAGYSEMGLPGTIAAGIQTAAIIASTAATVSQIKSTNRNSTSSNASVAAPQVSAPEMASVNPLIDEQTDINRMTSLNENGDSTKETQNLRVYVVDQDIRDANHKAKVVEDNTTF